MDGQGKWEFWCNTAILFLSVISRLQLFTQYTIPFTPLLYFNFIKQAEQAQHIYIENEERLEEMLDGIEKLFGWVKSICEFNLVSFPELNENSLELNE